jgi:hypothetical protein
VPFCFRDKHLSVDEYGGGRKEKLGHGRQEHRHMRNICGWISGDGATKYLGKLAKWKATEPMALSSRSVQRRQPVASWFMACEVTLENPNSSGRSIPSLGIQMREPQRLLIHSHPPLPPMLTKIHTPPCHTRTRFRVRMRRTHFLPQHSTQY